MVVEDEIELARLIDLHLTQAGMQTQIYHRASHARNFLQRNFANLLLLDIGLPDQTGFALLHELQADGIRVPAIFLTGNLEETSKVKALEMGGDDYVTKPFGFPELVARIHAVLRRAGKTHDLELTRNVLANEDPFDFCGAQLTPARLEITFPDGATEKIGRKELGIMAQMHGRPGVVVTRQELIHSVWGEHADTQSRSLDQYIARVRDLYKKHGCGLDAFRTVHGVGYIYDPKGVSQAGC